MTIWEILNIEKTVNIKEIRRAYAEMSKVYHPEREPEKFQQLYRAYHDALDYARNNQEEEDFWKEEDTEEYPSTEKALVREETSEEKVSHFDNLIENVAAMTEAVDGRIDKNKDSVSEAIDYRFQKLEERQEKIIEEIEKEEVQNLLFTESIRVNVSSDVIEAMAVFKEHFMAPGKTDWRKFMTKPEFLRVQFEEQFVFQLVNFLREQTQFAPKELPVDLLRELFFSYIPYMEEQGEDFFEDAFTALFDLLYKNEQIYYVIEQYDNPLYLSEVAKYVIYYRIRKKVLVEADTEKADIWMMYMADVNREFFTTDGVKSTRDNLIYPLLAFIITEAPDFSKEVYEYLIHSFRLIDAKKSSRWENIKPIYQAIENKGVLIDKVADAQSVRTEEIFTLIKEIEKLHKQSLTEDDRPMVHAFFHGELFQKYKLDHEFVMEKLYIYIIQAELLPRIFIEEYLAFYDEVYAETNSLLGREIYNLLSSRNKDDSILGQDYEEIQENRKEWVIRHFFEEGFTRVWESCKGGMRGVYRSLLTDHLETLGEQQNYEWDLWDDGHLYAIKDGNNYVFMHERLKEKVILSLEEYYRIMEELLEIYTGRYFCTSSEKNKLNDLKEKAGNQIWQS